MSRLSSCFYKKMPVDVVFLISGAKHITLTLNSAVIFWKNLKIGRLSLAKICLLPSCPQNKSFVKFTVESESCRGNRTLVSLYFKI